MTTESKLFSIVVAGEYACFTNPYNKADRISYACMTPTAARGLLESIYWKPEMCYEDIQVSVLKMGDWVTIGTSEYGPLGKMEADPDAVVSIYLDGDRVRSQRRNEILRDVSYLIEFRIKAKSGVFDEDVKHESIFHRRIQRGTYFRKPCLGLREFVASVRYATREDVPVNVTKELGTMLKDMTYTSLYKPPKRGKRDKTPIPVPAIQQPYDAEGVFGRAFLVAGRLIFT